MKTLEELIKELGLKPSHVELERGRTGNFVVLGRNNEYVTLNDDNLKHLGYVVIEVKPE